LALHDPQRARHAIRLARWARRRPRGPLPLSIAGWVGDNAAFVLRRLAFPFFNFDEGRPRALIRIGLQLALLVGVSALGLVWDPSQLARGHDLFARLAIAFLFVGWTGIVVGDVWIAARLFDRRPLLDLGLRVDRAFLLDLAFGFLLGMALMSAILGVEVGTGWASVSLAPERAGGVPRVVSWLIVFVVFVGVAIVEELVSRGYHLTNLAEGLQGKWLSPPLAVLGATMLSSVAFGAAHIANPHASPVSTGNIMLAGIMLAVGYVTTGKLAISLGLHLSWNYFQNLYGMEVSGQSRFLFGAALRREVHGPDWITGGAFGPEAGMTGLVAIVVGSFLILGWVRMRHGSLRIAPSITAHAERLRTRRAMERPPPPSATEEPVTTEEV
jgi:hypothetical protein